MNPAYQGVGAAVEELRRAVTELGLAGVKLYPMYQHWAVNDPELGFPIYETAQDLGIPVMIHQAGDARPLVAFARDLSRGGVALICQQPLAGDVTVMLPGEPPLFLLTKHPNFYTELVPDRDPHAA